MVGNPQARSSYTATIAIDAETMTVTVDIRTGDRRVAEFLLQPVLRYAAEGLREL